MDVGALITCSVCAARSWMQTAEVKRLRRMSAISNHDGFLHIFPESPPCAGAHSVRTYLI